ncbi:hypothetical protein CEXT_713781 [Caerostris extrusa]|uniref:Uncharacterized protein n=1 Tax=Caerostris extrusa TaxID=172846 RepID=A0AAV4UB49_CAEEX|nr:hypothetical protein CEXT_713781 [Caerostris extrusa]
MQLMCGSPSVPRRAAGLKLTSSLASLSPTLRRRRRQMGCKKWRRKKPPTNERGVRPEQTEGQNNGAHRFRGKTIIFSSPALCKEYLGKRGGGAISNRPRDRIHNGWTHICPLIVPQFLHFSINLIYWF